MRPQEMQTARACDSLASRRIATLLAAIEPNLRVQTNDPLIHFLLPVEAKHHLE